VSTKPPTPALPVELEASPHPSGLVARQTNHPAVAALNADASLDHSVRKVELVGVVGLGEGLDIVHAQIERVFQWTEHHAGNHPGPSHGVVPAAHIPHGERRAEPGRWTPAHREVAGEEVVVGPLGKLPSEVAPQRNGPVEAKAQAGRQRPPRVARGAVCGVQSKAEGAEVASEREAPAEVYGSVRLLGAEHNPGGIWIERQVGRIRPERACTVIARRRPPREVGAIQLRAGEGIAGGLVLCPGRRCCRCEGSARHGESQPEHPSRAVGAPWRARNLSLSGRIQKIEGRSIRAQHRQRHQDSATKHQNIWVPRLP
jgi:hypothetical protein